MEAGCGDALGTRRWRVSAGLAVPAAALPAHCRGPRGWLGPPALTWGGSSPILYPAPGSSFPPCPCDFSAP